MLDGSHLLIFEQVRSVIRRRGNGPKAGSNGPDLLMVMLTSNTYY